MPFCSTEQLQECHHVSLILLREDEASRTRTGEEEKCVMLRDVLERLRGVVVKVRSRVADPPQRQDLEEVRKEPPRRRRHSWRRARGWIVQHGARVWRVVDHDNAS